MNDPRNPQDPRFAATQFAPDQPPGQPGQPPAANPYAQQNPWQQPSQGQPAPQQTAYGQPAPYGAPPGGGGGADAYGNPQPGPQQPYNQPSAYGQPPGGFGYQPQAQQGYGAPPGAYAYPAVGPGMTSEGEIASNLKVMAVLQYVYAGFTALVSVFALLWVVLGGAMIFAGAASGGGDAASEAGAGVFVIIIAVVMLVALGVVVGLHVLAGRSLTQRRRHTFLIVVACLTMLSVPIGTAIGIWMLVILTKPEVKASFT